MAKQTAVEWIIQWSKENPIAYQSDYYAAIEQAKAMEKEQIAKAWDGGNYQYFCSKITNEDFDNGYEYYEEQYKSE